MGDEKTKCSECGQNLPKKEFRKGEGPFLTAREMARLAAPKAEARRKTSTLGRE